MLQQPCSNDVEIVLALLFGRGATQYFDSRKFLNTSVVADVRILRKYLRLDIPLVVYSRHAY